METKYVRVVAAISLYGGYDIIARKDESSPWLWIIKNVPYLKTAKELAEELEENDEKRLEYINSAVKE